MGFWNRLLHPVFHKVKEEPEENWNEIIYDYEAVDFYDEEQRSRYITGCIEQMGEATREINQLNGEYALVTSYLTDMEEIEAMPDEPRKELDQIANRLMTLEKERQQYLGKTNRMSDGDFYRMRKQENEVTEGIEKLKEAERYQKLVKSDLKRLDVEKHAYYYRQKEMITMQANLRGMAVIFISAMAACMVMLAVLQFIFEMNTIAGYMITVLAGAIAITVVCVKYIDSDREIRVVERAIGKLTQLQNKVKIRYVNNTNLLEYLCMKYGTESAKQLEKRWNLYQEEKEQRKQFEEAEAKLEHYQQELIKLLARYRVSDPNRWINQVAAILDHREMVEIRHELILRRQALRQQLDYNQKIKRTALDEIERVKTDYPVYAQEIAEMVEKCIHN